MNSTNKIINYPETKKLDLCHNYFGKSVNDPFNWLEDDVCEDTKNWIAQQNDLTFSYLNSIPFRDRIKDDISSAWNYEKMGIPFIEGEKLYYFKNSGLQNQRVLYQKCDNEDRVFIDPNKFSEDGTVSLFSIEFSKSGKYAAYSVSTGGSDWKDVHIIDTLTLELLGDFVSHVKFSPLSWYKNDGFFYSAYDLPDGSMLSSKTDRHKIFYHKLGTDQEKDILIFGDEKYEKRRYVRGIVTDDDRYLSIYCSQSTSGNELYIADLENFDLSSQNLSLKCIKGDFESDNYVLHNFDSKFLIVTNHEAHNKKIVSFDLNLDFKAGEANTIWNDFIDETDHVLNPSVCGDYIYCLYLKDAVSMVMQYDTKGVLIREISLPGIGTVSGFYGNKDQQEPYFSFSNYVTPGSIYRFDPVKGVCELFWKPDVSIDLSDCISEQVFYESFDKKRVPMIITYKKSLQKNGKNPLILYGYGGFNISLTPSYNPNIAVWIKYGGIYAVPNIRGGGEYGKEWHRSGIKFKKKNVFNDFISAAEYLIEKGFTDTEHLAIKGGSNGGLLVGAALTMRPDLFKVAIPSVGVLDMLRYHRFTSGAGWAYDYGTADDSKEMFEYILSYSPLHNVNNNTQLPATLVTTGDHDDRVVPCHSFKFAAELQNRTTGKAPKLIRIETKAGHGAGTPLSKVIELNSDIFAFILFNMGIHSIEE